MLAILKWINLVLFFFIIIFITVAVAMKSVEYDRNLIENYRNEVFDFGKRARLGGASSESNPYTGSYKTVWLEGWLAAGERE